MTRSRKRGPALHLLSPQAMRLTAVVRETARLCILLTLAIVASPAFAEPSEGRFCFGLIWCTEVREDGSRATDGFLFLYSSERKGDYSRLAVRPFYSMEADPAKGYLRRSVLWPLGSYERAGERVSSHAAPLYWHGEEPTLRYTLFLPLYFDYRTGDRSYRHIIPLYGHHTRGATYDKYFILGPSLIFTRDAERDLAQWDALFFLGHHRRERGRGDTWVLPLYFSGYDTPAGRSYRYVLPFYGDRATPALRHRFLFPLFGTETDPAASERRVSLLGLPPLRVLDPLPTFALYEHRTTPGRVTDRFFPLYRYASQPGEGRSEFDALVLYRHVSSPHGATDRLFPLYRYEREADGLSLQLSVLGYRELALASYHRDPSGTRTHLFPLYSSERRAAGNELDVAAVGYGPLSLYRHQSTPTRLSDRLFPLYAYDRNRETRALSVIGLSEVSLFRWSATPTVERHRLFPIYSYRHDQSLQTTDVGALLLYGHHRDSLRTTDRLMPLYSYASDESARTLDVGVLGVSPLTLYRHHASPAAAIDRLVPLYGFRRTNNETRLAALGLPPLGTFPALALYEHRTGPTRTSDRVFPLYWYGYDRGSNATSLNVLGLYHHAATPERTSDTLFPAYSFDRTSASLDLGVIGYRAASLFHYVDNAASLRHRLFPLYLYNHDRRADETVLNAGLLYWHLSSSASRTDVVFPLYGYRRRADETRVAALGLPPLGDIPALALYEHRASPTRTSDHFFPLYQYARDHRTNEVRWNALFLYQHRATPTSAKDAFLPLYDYEDERDANRFRVSLLGVPPLTLAQHRTIGDDRLDWIFPAYGYSRSSGETRLSALGLPPLGTFPALALYEHRTSPTRTSDRVFPMYRYVRDRGADATSLNVLGLYHHAATPERTRDTLFPLYSFDRSSAARDVAVIGYRGASLFHYVDDSSSLRHRLFPLYLYNHDRRANETVLNAGLLYWHLSSSALRTDVVFPLYGYRRRPDETRVAALGLPPLGDIPALALYEHRASATRTSDRLFPLYRYARDTQTNEVRWDALFLYQHRATPTSTNDALLPVYAYEDDRNANRFRVNLLGVPPLTLVQHRTTGADRLDWIFPAYGYRRASGETRLSALGLPPLGTFPAFALYEHRSTSDRVTDRFFPLYRVARDQRGAETHVNVLLLYERHATPARVQDMLFPLYHFDRSDTRLDVSAFGYREFSLFRYVTTDTALRHRLVPIYRYAHDRVTGGTSVDALLLYSHRHATDLTADRLLPLYDYRSQANVRSLSVLGWSELALYRHETSPNSTSDRLFPLYGYRRTNDERSMGALGYPPFSLYHHASTLRTTSDRLFPLYSYHADLPARESRLALLGLPHIAGWPTLSLYQHEASPRRTLDRLFPLYRYSHDMDTQRTRLGALVLFRASRTPGATEHSLFPLYSYVNDNASQIHRVGVLGYAPFSLYQHLDTSTGTSDRFLPIYTYAYDAGTTDAQLSVLWPLFVHHSRAGRTTETGVLWWLIHYERPDDAHRDFHVLGGSTMAVFRHRVAPERSVVEFNPILPFYYREITPTAAKWTLFGGLIGHTTPVTGPGHWQWLWFL